MEGDTKLYPHIQPIAPLPEPNSFRLQKICELQKVLESEQESRAALYKKYKRAVNAVDGIDTVLITASIAVAAVGASGLLTNIITIPLAAVLGLLSISGKLVGRKLQVKVKKHDKIRMLAASKLNTITDHVSRALRDGTISDDEFRLILDEVDKYSTMKAEIRSNAHKFHQAVKIDEEAKNELIKRARQEARESLIRKLDGGSS